ncbi:hypothetical protein AB0F18_23965 [Streptomyces sp. NPDC029216]
MTSGSVMDRQAVYDDYERARYTFHRPTRHFDFHHRRLTLPGR